MQDDVLLRVRDLTKCYQGEAKALDGVSFDVRKGEFVTVIGSSGAGKSTLLRSINRLIEPTAGSILFDDREITALSRGDLRMCRRRISMIFQHYNLVHRLTAIENVLHGRLGYKSTLAGALGLYTEEEKRRAFEALDQVGMADFAYKRADRLSGGQMQRVGIARALVQDPLLMLCDEPIASLDPKSSRTVMERLRWAADELGIACLVNLHQVDFALEFSDRIIGLSKGRKVFEGVPSELTDAAVREIYGDVDIDGLPRGERAIPSLVSIPSRKSEVA
ncbi:MAG: phosphonate ABC transporter ATP-binding protein [Slackia sp.]|nr:phosphonate ABC transporter ATP-binding protein [Slackia sp.]